MSMAVLVPPHLLAPLLAAVSVCVGWLLRMALLALPLRRRSPYLVPPHRVRIYTRRIVRLLRVVVVRLDCGVVAVRGVVAELLLLLLLAVQVGVAVLLSLLHAMLLPVRGAVLPHLMPHLMSRLMHVHVRIGRLLHAHLGRVRWQVGREAIRLTKPRAAERYVDRGESVTLLVAGPIIVVAGDDASTAVDHADGRLRLVAVRLLLPVVLLRMPVVLLGVLGVLASR